MDTLLSGTYTMHGRWTGNARAALTLTYGRDVISTDTIPAIPSSLRYGIHFFHSIRRTEVQCTYFDVCTRIMYNYNNE